MDGVWCPAVTGASPLGTSSASAATARGARPLPAFTVLAVREEPLPPPPDARRGLAGGGGGAGGRSAGAGSRLGSGLRGRAGIGLRRLVGQRPHDRGDAFDDAGRRALLRRFALGPASSGTAAWPCQLFTALVRPVSAAALMPFDAA